MLFRSCEAVCRKIQSKQHRTNNFNLAFSFLFISSILSFWWGWREWGRGNYGVSIIHPIIVLCVVRVGANCISMARKATLQIKENTFGETGTVKVIRRFATLLLIGNFYSIAFFAVTEWEVPSEKVLTCLERMSWTLTLYLASVRPLFRSRRRRR